MSPKKPLPGATGPTTLGPRMARTEVRHSTSFVALNALFMMAASAVAAWALLPVYDSTRYLLVAAVAILGGAGVAVLCDRLRWGASRVALLSALVYIVVGLTLAVPGALTSVSEIADAALDLVRGPVTGWKDIVTLPLPLGDYGTTLVPVLALFLAGTATSTWLAIRARRLWPIAALTAALLVIIAIAIGPAVRADALPWAPFGVYASREFLVGIAAFAVLLSWFGWRAWYTRRQAIATAFGAGGVQLATSSHASRLAGASAALVMVVVGVVAAVLVTAPIAESTPREVVRSTLDPRLVVESKVSPLSSYREYFGDDAFAATLFTVNVEDGDPQRVRLATLPYFDGEEFSAADPQGSAVARFQRVPSHVEVEGQTEEVTATVSIGAQSGIWVPIVGELGSLDFQGARKATLVDGFYYLADADAGVMVVDDGLLSGDAYKVNGERPAEMPSLTEIGDPPGVSTISPELIPDSLHEWVTRQDTTADAAGLAELVRRLRVRGYLSHAIESTTDGETPAWQRALGEYSFASSASGHSFDRIDRLFQQLNEREGEVGNADEELLVSGVGDDEQFATAVAMLASDMGFPSRVVIGARLTDTDAQGFAAPPCEAGVCRGENMTVWTEVQSDKGAWVPIDVTPQHATPVSPDVANQRDPQYASALDPQRAEPIVPPVTQRGQSDDDKPDAQELTTGWQWVGPALRIAGISLLGMLILFGPFLAILIWKLARRNRRRRGDARDVVYQGWDEYLDDAVDSGLPPLPRATRTEVAREYGTQNAVALATLTDRVTFGNVTVDDATADQYWTLVAADRSELLARKSWWGRVKMRLSLRSMWSEVRSNGATQAKSAESKAPQRWKSGAGMRSEHSLVTASHRRRTSAQSRHTHKRKKKS
ncbi:transglutaminase-like domain-containing protein [Demequina oxidasica]|uniref:transglutaminase-like domain-containing protein n=1 Tax=Demequina oxidasica TaxID=676199 RepID=UPI0007839FF8|nr:transglutaminase-like domain-containing protein [Demequina oxidasica]